MSHGFFFLQFLQWPLAWHGHPPVVVIIANPSNLRDVPQGGSIQHSPADLIQCGCPGITPEDESSKGSSKQIKGKNSFMESWKTSSSYEGASKSEAQRTNVVRAAQQFA
jgi:hypothetical protein